MKMKALTTAAFVFIVASSLIRSTLFPESDIFWGARNGIDILHNGIHIFQPDKWNAITLGEEWSPNSWLWNVLLGGAYLVFGNYGFLLLTLVTNVAAYSFLWGYLQKLRIAPLTAFFILLGSWLSMSMFMNGRGNTADFLLLTAFLYCSHHFRDRLVPLLVSSFSLTLLWMNLHLTGVMAAVLFPAIVYASLYKENFRKRLLSSSAVLAAVLIALPLTPFGVEGLLKVSLVKNESKDLIVEWSNVFSIPDANTGIFLVLVSAAIMGVLLLLKKQFLYGLLIIPLIWGTYDTIRLTPFLLAIVLAGLMFWEDQKISLPQKLQDIKPLMTILMICAVTVLAAVSIYNLGKVIVDDESMFYVKREELQLLPQNSRAAVSQDVGSAIILFRPDVLVTLDGRNDMMGRERFLEANNILYSDDTAKVSAWLEKYDINAVLIQDSRTASAEHIKKNMAALGWVEKKNDTDAVTYVKE